MATKDRKWVSRREVTVNLPVVQAPAKSLIDSLVANIFNPVIGILTGGVSLEDKSLCINRAGDVCETSMRYGQFFSDLVSFLIVAGVVYFVVKGLKLERLDKKVDKKD
jgi:large conductance mechanosensitive channel